MPEDINSFETEHSPAPCISGRTACSMDSAREADTGAGNAPSQPLFQRRNRGHVRKRQLGSDDEEDHTVVRPTKTAKDAPLAFSTKRKEEERIQPFKFQSDRNIQQLSDRGATKTLEIETAFDRDARSASVRPCFALTPPASSGRSRVGGWVREKMRSIATKQQDPSRAL